MSRLISTDKENAIQILEYWFTIEFLNQQNLKNLKNKSKKAIEYIEKIRTGDIKNKEKFVEYFYEFKSGDNLQTVVNTAVEGTGFQLRSDFTVFVGCMKKETCIHTIAQNVNWNGQSPEKNDDEIALAAFSLSKNGRYILNSLSISPLAWAVKRLSGGADNVSQALSADNYTIETSAIEEKITGLFGSVEDGSSISESNAAVSDIKSFSYDQLQGVEDIVLKELEIERSEIQSFFGVYFKLFASEEEKNKYDAKVGLRMDFYSEDLAFAAKGLRDNLFTKEKEKLLLDFILGLSRYYGDSKGTPNRFDVVKPQNEEELYKFVSETLTAKNAPLGKWPSRFMPALMQQIAVNLATDEETNLPVFSVNGPPGTGKTTLLKEIIVNNIIEKTKLLTEYDDPDAAFDDYSFEHGEGPDNSYNQYVRKYHRLKNKKINSYSILVASSNNTAVENITKELPVEEKIIEDLKPSDNINGPNREALAELVKLFTVSQNAETLPVRIWEEYTNESGEQKTRQIVVEKPDIYFSKLATDLLNAESENQNETQAFGLISASLGKKSNIDKVNTKVIVPLLEIMKRNNEIERRKQKYLFAREQFLTQLELVEKLCKKQDKLHVLEEETAKKRRIANDKLQHLEDQRTKLHLQLSEIDHSVRNLSENTRQLSIKKNKLDTRCGYIHATCTGLTNKINLLGNDIAEAQARLKAIKKSVPIVGKLFKTARYKEVQENAAKIYEELTQFQLKLDALNNNLNEEHQTEVSVHEEINRLLTEIENNNVKQKKLQSGREEFVSEKQRLEDEYTAIEREAEKQEKLYEKERADYQNQDSYERGFVLDRQFISDIQSSDKDISTQAQLRNPWFSEHYNREREKLFLYALLVTKEFILSSKKCRNNLKHLHCLWSGGYEKNEQIEFIGEDLRNCTVAAYETLFLLIPVVSSTFASIHSLFQNVKEEKIVGTLIVDEAGQASPHMAIGALCRARKAIIVGDPKQVEPIVTDDQDLLKQTYTDDIYKLYADKTNSVQRFADIMNPYGTYLKNEKGMNEWVGCPLLVHRRCISPMYEISNDISYNNIMKQQAKQPDAEKQAAFIDVKSQWINVSGKEDGNRSHFVKEQGDKVIDLLEFAFSKKSSPDIFIISPFNTVVSGIRGHVRSHVRNCKAKGIESSLVKHEQSLDNWLADNVGTVHSFQGKEADEVIFLLGCDVSANAASAIKWVNNNIVNVAATRAKYRFYVIGDFEAWKQSKCVKRAKEIFDAFNKDSSYTLVITEKPSVARAYAKVLGTYDGVYDKKAKYLKGNGHLISWCYGHLIELAKPDAYNKKYQNWRIEDLPIIPEPWKYEVKSQRRSNEQFYLLKQLMNREDVTEILCATDAGREGELIFRLVYQQAECEKPFRRIWLSSMEESSIREAFTNPKPSSNYDTLFEAARCRQLADWLVGMNATRYFSCLYSKPGEPLNVGRVTSPTLSMIIEREKEIETFVPELYYTVNLDVGGIVFKSRRYNNENEAIRVKRECSGHI